MKPRCEHAKICHRIRVYITVKGDRREYPYTTYRCQKTCCRKKRIRRKKKQEQVEYSWVF